MKILHVITSLHTGGAETLIVNMMPHFAAMGHEVGLVVFNGERTALMERLEEECPQCRIYLLGNSYYNPWYIVKLAQIMREYDIVHTHNSSPQLFAAIANILCHKMLVTTEHNTNNRKRGSRWLAKVDRWMYWRYDRIICISDKAEENLREYLNRYSEGEQSTAGREKIITIYNGINVDEVHNAKPLPGIHAKKTVTVMVAAFRQQKDQDTLVRAISLLPRDEHELWLVGDGERMGEVRQLVESLNMADNVRFWGNRPDVAQILHTADIIAMSTHYEGLSLSNIEGMAAGKPFVASDVDGIREVTEGYGILFPHADATALANIIKHLAEDKQYYDKVAQRCLARARDFDIHNTVKGYNSIYDDIKEA